MNNRDTSILSSPIPLSDPSTSIYITRISVSGRPAFRSSSRIFHKYISLIVYFFIERNSAFSIFILVFL